MEETQLAACSSEKGDVELKVEVCSCHFAMTNLLKLSGNTKTGAT